MYKRLIHVCFVTICTRQTDVRQTDVRRASSLNALYIKTFKKPKNVKTWKLIFFCKTTWFFKTSLAMNSVFMPCLHNVLSLFLSNIYGAVRYGTVDWECCYLLFPVDVNINIGRMMSRRKVNDANVDIMPSKAVKFDDDNTR